MRGFMLVLAALSLAGCGRANEGVVFNDNGGWCWFQDERAIIVGDRLVIASVANRAGTDGEARWGDIQITQYDLTRRELLGTTVLHEHFQDDDHAEPALLERADGRILAVYSKHGDDRFMRYRITEKAGDTSTWGPEQQHEREAGVTYSNLFRLREENGPGGRIFNFYRGEGWNPNFVLSDDSGESWRYGGRLIAFQGRPYVRYADDGRDTIHFITTEHHPRDFDNSIYHGFIRDGKCYRSDETPICELGERGIRPNEATRVFAGDPNHVGWTVDLELDGEGRPCAVYSVQMDKNMNDLRYRYGRWDGRQWRDYPMAYAGTALYPREADYSGLAALDPKDPSVVFISTDADPATGEPLISAADNKRHYEIFRGRTRNGGETWEWEAVTKDSTQDNLRPIVPSDPKGRTILLWLRGTYSTYTSYDLDVVGMVDL